MLFPQAFPPIVSAAIKLVTIKLVKTGLSEYIEDREVAIVIPAPPESIPHMSPMTSLQKLETWEFIFMSFKAVLAPFTFFEAIELKTFLSATVTLIPTMSKRMPRSTNIKRTIKLIKTGRLEIRASENIDSTSEITKAIMVTSIIHKTFLSKCKMRLSFLTFEEYLVFTLSIEFITYKSSK